MNLRTKLYQCIALLCTLAMLLGLFPAALAAEGDSADASADFVVLSTTDMHGKCWDTNLLNDTGVNNSMLKVASAVAEARETYGENVVLIDNGDLYQGTPISAYHISQYTSGEVTTATPMALCLKYIGYDVSVLGNHEFNYAWDTMSDFYAYLEAENEDGGSVAVLAANLYYNGENGTTRGERVFTPYTTKTLTVGGQTVKVGIIGLENTDCTRWDVPDNYPNMVFAHPDNTSLSMAWEVERCMEEMAVNGDGDCDFVIVAYHSGQGSTTGDLSFGSNTENQLARLVAETTGVDMVIAGHDHSSGYSNTYLTNEAGEAVLVVNGGGSALTKSVFTVTAGADGALSISVKSSENLDLKNYANDETLRTKIEPYVEAANSYVNQEVGTISEGDWDTVASNACYLEQSDTMDLINRSQISRGNYYLGQKYESAAATGVEGLDHLTVDLSSSSVVFSNSRSYVKPGSLSMKDIYGFYKYDNTLYIIPVTGQEIKDILEFVASQRLSARVVNGQVQYSTIGDSFTNPVLYGLDFVYDMSQEEGSRAVISGFANGNAFELDKVYLLAINNYHLGNGPFAGYSTADAIWSQTDDLGGGVIQDLIAEFVGEQTELYGGVSPAPSNWGLTWTGSLEDNLANTAYVAYEASAVSSGDSILIYNPANAAVLGTSLGVGTSSLKGTVLYADGDAALLTATAEGDAYTLTNAEGQYLTSTGGNNLTFEAEKSDAATWELQYSANGWLIRNVKNSVYLEYYRGNFTTYSSNNLGAAYLMEVYTAVPVATKLTEAPATGSQIVIYYDNGPSFMGSAASGSRLAAVAAPAPSGAVIPVYEGTAVLDVSVDENGYYTFTCGGKYLTSGEGGNSLSFADSPSDYSLWALEAAEGGWFIRSVNASYNGNKNQYLEVYGGNFTVYGKSSYSDPSAYTFNLYAFNGYATLPPEEDVEPEDPNAYVLPVFETTDVHGYLVDTSSGNADTYQYRLAYIANILDETRNGSTSNTILLDSGDIYQGNVISNLLGGESMMEAYEAMGYDAVGLGNHEFDWGIYEVADSDGTVGSYTDRNGVLQDSQIPILACNVYDAETGESVDFTRDYVILEKTATNAGGETVTVKVAVVGYVPDYSADIMAARIEPYLLDDENGLAKAESIAKELESSGTADASILLVHAGASSTAAHLGADTAFDLVLGGHSHQNQTGATSNGLVYLQTNSQAQSYGYVELRFDEAGDLTGVSDSQVVGITSDASKLYASNTDGLSEELMAISQAALEKVAPTLGNVLGYIETSITKGGINGNPSSSTAGNWMTDLMNRAANAQVSLTNNGGIRTTFEIPEGADTRDITAGDVYTIAPFGNLIYVYELTYGELKDLLEEALGARSLGLRMSGIECYYTGTTVTTLIMDGVVIYTGGVWTEGWESRTLRVTTNEYVATAMDGFIQYNGTDKLVEHSLVDNEAFLEVLQAERAATGGLLYVDPNPYFINGDYEAHEHNYVSTVVEPTAGRSGYTYHECSICGRSYIDEIVPPLSSGGSEPVTWYAITVAASANGSVSVSPVQGVPGQLVTVTVSPDSGYDLASLAVTTSGGAAVALTAAGGRTYTFTMPNASVTVAAVFAPSTGSVDTGLPFTDVDAEDWFYDEVVYVYEGGLMTGTSSTTFSPALDITRGMIVTILYRMEGRPAVTTASSFTDVASGLWYSDAVAWAAANDIVGGYGNNTFGPEDNVTREQMAVILYRYAQYKGMDTTQTGSLSAFTDGSSTSSWALDAMRWAVGSGLMAGRGGGVLAPRDHATRAEVATLLTRFCA